MSKITRVCVSKNTATGENSFGNKLKDKKGFEESCKSNSTVHNDSTDCHVE